MDLVGERGKNRNIIHKFWNIKNENTTLEKDLANDIIDKSDNNFNDTFKHFSDQSNDIDAYDGNDFSYL